MMRAAPKSWALASLVLSAALLTGCAHTPQPHYYVLSGPSVATNESTRSGPSIGIGPLLLPDYLDRPQIVTRATDSRLVLSNEHRWAEPLNVSFARALLGELEKQLPTQNLVVHPWRASLDIARQVRIDITRFERDAGGGFHLGARWSVTNGDNSIVPATRVSEIEVPVNGQDDDYDALVAAANSAVAALASAIATQLQAP